MTIRSKLITTIVVLFVLFVIAEYRMPRRFQWKPTFAHNDPQPFGCEVFDSILSTAMPHGYTVKRATLRQLEKDGLVADSTGRKAPKAILIITNEGDEPLVAQALRLAKNGNSVIVATTAIYDWKDSLGIRYNWNNNFSIDLIIKGTKVKQPLHWWQDKSLQNAEILDQLIERELLIPNKVTAEPLVLLGKASIANETPEVPDDPEAPVDPEVPEATVAPEAPEYTEEPVDPEATEYPDDPEATEEEEYPIYTYSIAVAFPMGRGEIILVSAPLLMTNYGMLFDDGHRVIAHIMGHVSHLPVIRTESYMSVTAHTESSPLYVLLQRPPFRWAIYLTMLTLLLFCLFTARRRQRVIPIIERPRNGNLEFTRLIGTLFYQQHDNPALLAKKLSYTADALRTDAGIDLDDPPDDLRPLISEIKDAISSHSPLPDQQLKAYIDQLDILLTTRQ